MASIAPGNPDGTVCATSYSTDLTDEQWALLEPVFNAPGKRGPKHAPDLRKVVHAMLYVSHTGCQRRYLPESFGPWTRVWVAVPPLVAQRHLGASADGFA